MKFKLTSSQTNFYNKKFTLDSQIWNQGVMQIFPKVYSYEQLNNAYNKLVETHDSLRVKLIETENGVMAEIKEHEHRNYRFWQAQTEDDLMKMAQDFLNEPTDRYGLLVDCAVFQTPNTSGIMINAHHIVVDGFSAYVMSEHINGFLNDENFAPVIQKYADYVAKEEKYKLSHRYKKSQEFWLKEFSTKPEFNIIPTVENILDFSSSEINRIIPADLFGKIKDLCNKHEITPASFFNTVNAIYFHKKYEVENFTIGVPVFNRTASDELNTIGLYMHLVPLVIRLEKNSFIENARKIENSKMNIFRYQSFTQQDIKALLNKNEISVNQLFDVVSDYQEFSLNEEYEMRIPYGNTLSVPIEMHLQSFDEINHNLKIRYRTAFFSEQNIRIMLNSIFAIIEDAVENPEKIIHDIETVSVQERQKLIYDFNSTKVEYEKDKCIHELFEAQAERTPEKTALVATDKTLTYRKLNEEANKIAHSLIEKGIGKGDIVGLMLPRKSYLLSALLGILKTGAAYLPIDMELPKERIEYMCKDTNATLVVSSDNIASLLELNNISNPQIHMTNDSLCYCIYTSGSTGQPKGVMAKHRNVVNYISKNEHNIFGKIVKDNFESILSISTCSFDIFVTETIAPLVNGLRVVLADEQQCRNQYALNKLLSKEKGEFLQTTPTKLKVLTAELTQRDFLKDVKAILLGGEAMEMSYLNELKGMTDAKIYNIYGTTEVPIWSTFADTDTFIDAVTIGKPIANTQVYIVDKYLKPVPMGTQGELCIAGDSVSAGYLNRPEQTTEKFIDNPFGKGKMYRTGDNAYWREDGNIGYIGRNDFQVKIRGLRIELGEIESVLQTLEGIKRAVVVVRKDKEDRQLICAFYTGEEKNAAELRKELSKKLPKYMVPHIFTHMEEMPLTSSGKANRNALPEIDFDSIETGTEYVAPETKEEEILTECVKEVLGIETLSTLDNFFDIGGDSLKAIELTSRLETKGFTVEVKTIFSSENLQELAKALIVKESEYIKVEYGNILPATPAQMRVYTAQMMSPDSTLYNILYSFRTEELNIDRLEKAINTLIKRHESLRTHFENIDGKIMQVIDKPESIAVMKLSSDDATDFSNPFDLTVSPLIRVGYYEDTVMIEMHHITVDGETMPVFFKELNELYMGRALSDEAVQYGEFAVQEVNHEESEKYWLEVFNEELPSLELPTDFPRKEKQSFNGNAHYDLIDIELHNKIREKCKKLGITPYVFYMTGFVLMLSKYSGNEDITVGMPISGRSSRFLDTVGMFVNTVALRSRPEGTKSVLGLMKEIRDHSIAAIDNQNYPFGELIKKLNIEVGGRNPLFDVMLAYQSEEMTDIVFGDKKAELLPTPIKYAKCDFTFNVLPRANDVVLAIEHCTDLYKEETIHRFAQSFKLILEQCLTENALIAEISAMNETEKNDILVNLNATETVYCDTDTTTIYSLFEKTAKNNSKALCISTAERNVTFGEFLDIAENLDKEIRKITLGRKSIIAVICERSVEMYGAIYGIIRGGNAYLPISPDYPKDRIAYILENSDATLVIAQDKFIDLSGDVPCIDMTSFINKAYEKSDYIPYIAEADDTAYVIYTSGSTGNPKGAKISHRSAVNRILWMHEKYPLQSDSVILQKTPYTFDVSVWELFWWGMCGGKLAASKPGEHFLPAKILDEVNNNKVTHLHFVPSVFDLFLNYLENHQDELYKFNSVKYVFLSGEALTASLIHRFYALFDSEKVGLHNLYGPTECAVDVSFYDCSPNDIDPVPIGKPIGNTMLYVVDKHMNPVPLGVKGELCIGGVNVGQGYLNNEELTAEKFIDNPFGEGKIYKTGDLAYIREDGEIIFCGRMDNQIKLNGQRIEIGEIDAVIESIPEIETAAVILKNINNKDMLVAFYCAKENCDKLIHDICSEKLPTYMVPSAFCRIDEMPLNASGKLDRKVLKEKKTITVINAETEAPVNELEKFISDAFSKILEIKDVGRNSNFFSLGGTSLSMISLLSEDGFSDITAAELIANPTPKMLALILEAKSPKKYEYIEALQENKDAKKTLVLFPYAGGGAEAFTKLINELQCDSISVYFVRYLHSEKECEQAASEIKDFFAEKELYFYSHCVGSAVALEIIRILEKENCHMVKHFIAGASIPSRKPIKKNSWNYVPDKYLAKKLIKAGAALKDLPDSRLSAILQKFREDTDFAVKVFYDQSTPIKCPMTSVINKNDIFTKDYKHAKELWQKYAINTENVHFIDAATHYFQSDNARELTEIILSIIR
ncbi:MAG: amino acid adenylation domain-containing protein [Clostridia bacterium]|nr:amino acid adenylation domain-containing protein [Clostridia bacterium]